MEWTFRDWSDRKVRLNDKGYREIHMPEHPKHKDGWVLEHRLVMENFIKRFLKTEEVVHHVNEKKTDNRIENLWLTDEEEHAKIHRLGKVVSQSQKSKVRRKQWKNTMNAKRDEFGRFKKSYDD